MDIQNQNWHSLHGLMNSRVFFGVCDLWKLKPFAVKSFESLYFSGIVIYFHKVEKKVALVNQTTFLPRVALL